MTETTGASVPVSIPTSSTSPLASSDGPHASFASDAVTRKPNQQSPPRSKSPMPPTASLTDAGLTMINGSSNNGDEHTADANARSAEQANGSTGGSGSRDSGLRFASSATTAGENGHQTSSSLPIPSPPAEVEATLTKLTSHANVRGVLVLSRPEALVIRSGGAYFDPSGPGASERAVRLKSVVEMVRGTIQSLERDIPKAEAEDELTFLRIRTKRYEMMISPSEKYLLVVIQDPTVSS